MIILVYGPGILDLHAAPSSVKEIMTRREEQMRLLFFNYENEHPGMIQST